MTTTRFARPGQLRPGASQTLRPTFSSVRSRSATKKISLRPGARLKHGRSLRPGSGPQNAAVKVDQGPKLKDQTGPRRIFTIEELREIREKYRELPKDLPHVPGVTGLGLGLQDDAPDTWDDTAPPRELKRLDISADTLKHKLVIEKKEPKSDVAGESKQAPSSDVDNVPRSRVNKSRSKKQQPLKPSRVQITSRTQRSQSQEAPKKATPPAPKAAKPKWERPKGLDPMAKLEKKVKGILNKLTVDKFDGLSEQLCEWTKDNIKDADQSQKLVSLIFDKAVDEPDFVKMYADLCVRVNEAAPNFEVDKNRQPAKPGTFLRTLVTQCQKRFQDGVVEVPRPLNMSDEDYEYLTIKQKKHMIGNIHFIGELFIVNLIREIVVHNCIQSWLAHSNPSPDDLHQLCELITTTGKQLDETKHKKYEVWMNDYFSKLRQLGTRPGQESRVKFMIMDVIDLRANKWVPLKKKSGPKTIEEVHKEAETELMIQDIQSGVRTKLVETANKYGFSSGDTAPPISTNDLIDSVTDIGGGAFKTATAPSSNFQRSYVRYEGRQRAQKMPEKNTSNQAGQQDSTSSGANFSQNFNLLPSRKVQVRRKPIEVKQPEKPKQQQPVAQAKAQTPAKIQRAPNDEAGKDELVTELYESDDLEDAKKKFSVLCFDPTEFVADFIRTSIDRGEDERKLTTSLLSLLVDDDLISGTNIEEALTQWMEMFVCEMMDVPQLSEPEYLGGIFARLLVRGSISVSYLTSSLKLDPDIKDGNVDEKFVGHILTTIINESDVPTAKGLLDAGSSSLEELMPTPSIRDPFLQKHDWNSS